jgi:copper(I)-binding protein
MRRVFTVFAAMALMVGACGGGDDAVLGLSDAWARPALGPNGAVYVTIEGGAVDTALNGVSVSPEIAASAELHQTVIRDNGLMGMVRVAEVEVPADSTVMMVPGGLHLMLIDLAAPLKLDDTFDITVTFDNGTEHTTSVEVRDE